MGILKRISSPLFWGLLFFVVLDAVLPFFPLGSAIILIGLFSTSFMRGWANLLLKYCDAASSWEYCIVVTFEGEDKPQAYNCPMFIQHKNKRELIIPSAYREDEEKGVLRSRARRHRVEGTYTHLEVSKVQKAELKRLI